MKFKLNKENNVSKQQVEISSEVYSRAKAILDEEEGNEVSSIKRLREEFGLNLIDAKKIFTSVRNKEYSFTENALESKPVSYSIVYIGGHPKINNEKNATITIYDKGITINYGLNNSVYIPFSNVVGVHYETKDQIERRITATRIVTLGIFAVAFLKKKKITEKFFTVDYEENGLENTILFSGSQAQKAHSETFTRLSKYKLNNRSNESVQQETVQTNDPYEELKKLKELLDMGIVTQEEFDKKKKELLGL